MGKVILLSLLFTINCNVVSQIVDLGYKSGCLDFYTNIIYEKLYSIIDSTAFNKLINSNERFRVQVTFSTKTGYPIEVSIIDNSNILSDTTKEEYKSILFKIQFDFCHSAHDVHWKPAREVFIGESAGFTSSSVYVWWYRKNFLSK